MSKIVMTGRGRVHRAPSLRRVGARLVHPLAFGTAFRAGELLLIGDGGEERYGDGIREDHRRKIARQGIAAEAGDRLLLGDRVTANAAMQHGYPKKWPATLAGN